MKDHTIATSAGVVIAQVSHHDITEQAQPAPTIAETIAALDVLAEAARVGEEAGYRAALDAAARIGATEDQIQDAYSWGRRGLGAAGFDHHGNTKGERAVDRTS